MPQLLWDASSLAKRYFDEDGSDTVDALFSLSKNVHWATYIGYAETAAILRRKFNMQKLDFVQFNTARLLLDREVLGSFTLLTIMDSNVLAGVTLTDTHNINSTDAAILATFLRHQRGQAAGSTPCVLVASDLRLIRAANVEGLPALNPETVAAADVPAFLAAL